MRRIREALNLKFKDYVFIDDRGDQRELVADAFPEMHVLDATSERTWRLLEQWSNLLTGQDEADRTRFYRERAERESFMATEVTAEENQSEAFAKLKIRVTLREAKPSDLKRVVELINRTNQFNLVGSRTSFREASEWQSAPNTRILVAEAADKFGPMGLVCVAVAEIREREIRIPTFVLSCRVFGYGIETVVLNAIRRLVTAADSGNEA
jgi:FkbH-like protein